MIKFEKKNQPIRILERKNDKNVLNETLCQTNL